MQALQITSPLSVKCVEIDHPGPPNANEVLLKVRQVGFCGSDLSTYRGLNPLVSYPRIPGHEIAATIEERGQEVPEKWQVGQNVLVSPYTNCNNCPACRNGRPNACRSNETLGVQREGGMAEFIRIPHEKLLFSPSLSIPELALVEPLTVGFHAVARGEVSESDTVAVIGCGAIGLGAIAGAAERGARVIAIDIDEDKLNLAKCCGASILLNSSNGDVVDQLKTMTNGDGPDVMIEAVGLPATFRLCVEAVTFTGRIVYIGYAKAPVEYETKFFVMKELDIRGSRNALPKDFERVITYLEGGKFPAAQMITKTVPLKNAPEALSEWHKNPNQITKIHVSFNC